MIVCPDNYRMIEGKYVFDRETEGDVWKRAYKAFYQGLLAHRRGCILVGPPGSGKSTWLAACASPNVVYFDATGTKLLERRILLILASVTDSEISAVVFRTPLTICLQRNAERSEDRRIPENVIFQMYLNIMNTPPTLEEGFSKIDDIMSTW